MMVRMQESKKPYVLLVVMSTSSVTVGINMDVPQKAKGELP
jgi:hypothetical protein